MDGNLVETDLSSINPSFIENIKVLKDTAATSLYGSRGANGVIIINTKKDLTKKEKKELLALIKNKIKQSLQLNPIKKIMNHVLKIHLQIQILKDICI